MWQKIKSNSFIKNMSVLMSGTAIAQGLILAASPILTRLYDPETFGLLGLLTAIIGVLSAIMTMRYGLAIVLPKEDKGAANLLFLSIAITISWTIVLSALVMLFGDNISRMLGSPELSEWLWLVPIGAFAIGAYNALKHWSTRKKQFQRLSISQVIRSSGMVSTQITAGLISIGPAGLLGGQVFGQFLATVALSYQVLKEDLRIIVSHINVQTMKKLAVKYKDFPLFSTSQALVNNLSQNAAPFLLAAFFGPAIVGFYTLGLKLVQMPANLVGQAFHQVYYQRAAELTNNNNRIDKHMLKASGILAIVGLLPAVFLFIFSPQLFSFILGEEWYVAGQYSSWLILWMYFWFLNRPVISVIQIYSWQKYLLIHGCILLLARIIAIYMCSVHYDALTAVAAYSILGAVSNPILLISTYIALKNKKRDLPTEN